MTGLECLALAIFWEARGEPVLGQELVAQVVVNRVRDWQYPDTVCAVVYQPGQFEWVSDGVSIEPYDPDAWAAAQELAAAFLFDGHQAPVEFALDLLNFHATYVAPDWHDRQAVLQYYGHVFYVRPD